MADYLLTFAEIVFLFVVFVVFLLWLKPRVMPAKQDVLRILLSNKKHKYVYFESFPLDRIYFKMDKLQYAIDYEPDDIYENTTRKWYSFHATTYRYVTLVEGAIAPSSERTFQLLSHRTQETYATLMKIHAINRTEKIENKLVQVSEFPTMMFIMVAVMALVIGVVVGIAAGPHLTALNGGAP